VFERSKTIRNLDGAATGTGIITYKKYELLVTSRNSSVGTVTGCGLDDRGSIPDGGWEFFFSPPRPDRLWGPPSLLSNGYRE
jgi:hypothetical protein